MVWGHPVLLDKTRGQSSNNLIFLQNWSVGSLSFPLPAGFLINRWRPESVRRLLFCVIPPIPPLTTRLPNVTKFPNVLIRNALEAPQWASDAALGCHPTLVAPSPSSLYISQTQQPKNTNAFKNNVPFELAFATVKRGYIVWLTLQLVWITQSRL